jgi:hypothetical protein
MPQMIIANRLVDGVVVFFDAQHGWVEGIDDGLVVDSDAEAMLALAKADEGRCLIVDPNLIEVEVDGGRLRPTAIREAIRAFGPSVRTDLANVS